MAMPSVRSVESLCSLTSAAPGLSLSAGLSCGLLARQGQGFTATSSTPPGSGPTLPPAPSSVACGVRRLLPTCAMEATPSMGADLEAATSYTDMFTKVAGPNGFQPPQCGSGSLLPQGTGNGGGSRLRVSTGSDFAADSNFGGVAASAIGLGGGACSRQVYTHVGSDFGGGASVVGLGSGGGVSSTHDAPHKSSFDAYASGRPDSNATGQMGGGKAGDSAAIRDASSHHLSSESRSLARLYSGSPNGENRSPCRSQLIATKTLHAFALTCRVMCAMCRVSAVVGTQCML